MAFTLAENPIIFWLYPANVLCLSGCHFPDTSRAGVATVVNVPA